VPLKYQQITFNGITKIMYYMNI